MDTNTAFMRHLEAMEHCIAERARTRLQQLGSRVDLEDYMQIVRMEVFSDAGQCRATDAPQMRAWINRIADNKLSRLVSYHHAAARNIMRELATDETHTLTVEAEQKVENEDYFAKLNECLHCLDERSKKVIQLRFFEGASFEDIAIKCGTTAEAARSVSRRGLNQLRRMLS